MTTATDRQWIQGPTLTTVPEYPNVLMIRGQRSDGLNFVMNTGLEPEDRWEVVEKILRMQFDTFLSPDCECVVGHNCLMHELNGR